MVTEKILKIKVIANGVPIVYSTEKIDDGDIILYRLTWKDADRNLHEMFSYVYSDLLDFLKFKLK